jgi:hypothetical protein
MRRDATVFAKHLPGGRIVVCCSEDCLRGRLRTEAQHAEALARLLSRDGRPYDPRPSLLRRLLAALP